MARKPEFAHPDRTDPAVSAGAPAWVTSELIADTLDHWQFHYDEALTNEDALEILLNAARLLELLEE